MGLKKFLALRAPGLWLGLLTIVELAFFSSGCGDGGC
jgi:hypothetical protein